MTVFQIEFFLFFFFFNFTHVIHNTKNDEEEEECILICDFFYFNDDTFSLLLSPLFIYISILPSQLLIKWKIAIKKNKTKLNLRFYFKL